MPNLSKYSWLLLLTALLCSAGLMNLYSISLLAGLGAFKKQLIWVLAGLLTVAIISRLRPLTLRNHSLTFYLFFLALLALIFVFGKTVSGSRSWFQIGPVSVQPSEFIKIGIIMVLANYYANEVATKENYNSVELLKPIALLLVPTAAVIAQPDMGTAITILLIGSSVILLLGISRKALLQIIIIALISIVPVWHFLIKDYQKERIYSFMDTSSDPFGISYNSIQSQIAIGSGMGFGKGFSLGSQSNLNFLPAHHTDFAFSVISEESGFSIYSSSVFLDNSFYSQHRNIPRRSLRDDCMLWNRSHVLLARRDKYRHGNGTSADHRHSSFLHQLRRFVNSYSLYRNRYSSLPEKKINRVRKPK